MSDTIRKRFLGVLIFLSGIAVGWLVSGGFVATMGMPLLKSKLEKHTGQYEFINPLLECDVGEQYISRELQPFKEHVEDLIEQKVGEEKAKTIAVYFKDLNNGPFFAINEEEYFVPGSLLKIPILMGYLKQAEFTPAVLDKKIYYGGIDFGIQQFVKPAMDLALGRNYTVRELLERMVVYSDNYSSYLLVESDMLGLRERVYMDLGLPVPASIAGIYTLDIKDDASFFRVLFNASYLGKDMSNMALKLLSLSSFRDGLVAGVPHGMVVAHKFGERDEGSAKQFHDCGIVYYPQYPYLLCVMTKGESYPDLISVIADVSRLTYEEVDRQMKSHPN